MPSWEGVESMCGGGARGPTGWQKFQWGALDQIMRLLVQSLALLQVLVAR